MRKRVVGGLMRQLVQLSQEPPPRPAQRPRQTAAAHRPAQSPLRSPWKYVRVQVESTTLRWNWDKEALRQAVHRDGAYLLRTNLVSTDPQTLWGYYIQLTEVEAAFRALKKQSSYPTDLALYPASSRSAHHGGLPGLLSVGLFAPEAQELFRAEPSPWQMLDQLARIMLVEVLVQLHDGGCICLERVAQPEPAQQILIHQLSWSLPQQPPPKIFTHQLAGVWTT